MWRAHLYTGGEKSAAKLQEDNTVEGKKLFIFFIPSLLQWEFVYSSSLCFLLVVLEIQYVYVSTTGMCWG